MNEPKYLQEILGTDKKNPVFSIYREEETKILHVYFGAELLEKVPEDVNHFEFKFMLGRLYNAGIKQSVLQKTFNCNVKTMKRWGSAIKCGNPAKMVKILAGRFANKKLTPEIISYIQLRFLKIYETNAKSYNREIRKEIEEVFLVRLCPETIRPILQNLKKQLKKICPEEIKNTQTSGDIVIIPEYKIKLFPSQSQETSKNVLLLPRQRSTDFSEFSKMKTQFNHHLGVLIFSSFLSKVEATVGQKGWLVKQWLACLLLGAVNIEQSKLLDFDDLDWMFGKTLRCLHPQRTELGSLASANTAEKLLNLNAEIANCNAYDDFYYDPHTKHYTGQLKILKGWCGSKHYADKIHHMDFIHTSDGQPVYISYADNYEDLRERFFKNIKNFRKITPSSENKIMTFIVDRGIYGLKHFESVIDDSELHLVTWEKDYKPIVWNSKDIAGSFILERFRNNHEDIKKYHFEYQEEPWKKDPRMRFIRVQATNPKNKTIQLGILTDDKDRPAPEIIRLMFKRWVQENDFKYLEKHFGINQITSYEAIPYKNLKNQIEDKQIKSGAYLAIQKERTDLRLELKNLLFQENQHPNKNPDRLIKIKNLSDQDKSLSEKLDGTQKEISKLDHLIEENYYRLDTSCKQVMDVLKIIARNAFYQTLKPFKKMYNNFRDDHAIFRNLTRSHGFVVETQNLIIVHLIPTAHYSPGLKKIVETFLDQLNKSNLIMPDHSNKIIIFKIGEKSGFELASK